MRIIVTGGSGNVGRYVVEELIEKGHEVKIFDCKLPDKKLADFVQGDILDISQCRKAFDGSDVVVHLAAIPHPLNDPPERVMYVNVQGTFVVHQAASDVGVKRVVHASSDSSYGFVFRDVDFLPEYLPLDENHPQKPQDAYGLSKVIGEEIARSFTRKGRLQAVAMRICFVWFPEYFDSYKPLVDDPGQRKWMNGLWLYNDARDVATAFRLAVESDRIQDFDVFLISAEDNGTVLDTMELVKRYYPGQIEFRKEIPGRTSLADWSKAREILGYKPKYTWRDIIKS